MTLLKQQCAGQVNSVEGYDYRGHGQGCTPKDKPRHPDGTNPLFNLSERFLYLYHALIIQGGFESKPVNHAARLYTQQLAGVGTLLHPSFLQRFRLRKEDSEHHAGIQIDNQR